MPRRRRTLAILSIAALLIAALLTTWLVSRRGHEPSGAGTIEVDAEEGTTRVGFSMAETRNSWTTELVDHMSNTARVHDMEIVFHDLEEKTSEAQLADALAMLDDGIDYLVLLPRITDIIPEIVEAADAREIPVVLICSDLNFRDRCSGFISIDYELEGRLCAKELARKYNQGICNIVEILGPEDSSIATQREKGFRSELENYPWLRIVESVQGDFNRVSAEDEITDLIGRMPKGSFQAVFACSDEDGLGALSALKLAGYKPGQEVSIVSVNGIQDALKALIAGEYTATIESGKNLGEQVVIMVERLRNQYRKSRYWVVPYHIYNEQSEAWALNAALYW